MAQRRRQRQMWLTGGAIAVVIVVVAVFVIIKLTGGTGTTTAASTDPAAASTANAAVTTALYDKYTAATPAALAAAANNYKTGISYPTLINGKPVSATGKPEVLYIGAEYCPYCATERWAMVLALSKFGTFTNLSHIHSSSTDVYANTQTFSFYKSSYTSKYVKFVPVETTTENEKVKLQTPTAAQDAIISKYDSGQNIPFVYFNGKSYLSGAEYNPQLLQGKTFDEIANQVAAGKTSLASSVYANAGTIVSHICHMTGGKPGSVCKSFPKPITS